MDGIQLRLANIIRSRRQEMEASMGDNKRRFLLEIARVLLKSNL